MFKKKFRHIVIRTQKRLRGNCAAATAQWLARRSWVIGTTGGKGTLSTNNRHVLFVEVAGMAVAGATWEAPPLSDDTCSSFTLSTGSAVRTVKILKLR